MTENQLKELLDGQDLSNKIDIRTLIYDMIKKLSDDELTEIFYTKLPEIDSDYVKRFIYMTRA